MPERHGQSNRGIYFTKTDKGSRKHRNQGTPHLHHDIVVHILFVAIDHRRVSDNGSRAVVIFVLDGSSFCVSRTKNWQGKM
jgi:hypothetical protein